MRTAEASINAVPAADAPTRAWLTPLELVVLAAIWGVSFMFQRVAAPEFGTAALSELRLAFGAMVLLPFLWRQRAAFPAKVWPKVVLRSEEHTSELQSLMRSSYAVFCWKNK